MKARVYEKWWKSRKKYVGKNFGSNLLLLGGLGLAVHYEQLSTVYDGVPLIMAFGHLVSGKTTAVKAAMAVIGQEDKTGGNSILVNQEKTWLFR